MSTIEGSVRPSQFLGLLADDLRWQIVSYLARGDCRVQELVEQVGRPMNLVSYHLGKLRSAKLVRERRSDADSRDVYYGLDLERLRELYLRAGEEIHPGLTAVGTDEAGAPGRAARPPRVLFLCTENSARSQMAEGILRIFSRGEVAVVSAGSRPTQVHPLAIKVLGEHGIDISQQRSKSLSEFLGETFDYVITVCDRVREECPSFPGDPERIHWSFADPAAAEGSEEQRYLAFKQTAKELMTMIRYLIITIERKRKEAV